MNYVKIDPCSISNGDGVRVAVFVAGCDIHCPNCHNQEAWDFNAGQEWTQETMESLLCMMAPYIDGLSILGGEPLALENIDTVREICETFKDQEPGRTIWLYTGKTIDPADIEMWSLTADEHFTPWGKAILGILKQIDVLVDGPFVQELHNPSLTFKGSSNQRIWKRNEDGIWEISE